MNLVNWVENDKKLTQPHKMTVYASQNDIFSEMFI